MSKKSKKRPRTPLNSSAWPKGFNRPRAGDMLLTIRVPVKLRDAYQAKVAKKGLTVSGALRLHMERSA